jgi:hypothetical protein
MPVSTDIRVFYFWGSEHLLREEPRQRSIYDALIVCFDLI